MSVLLPPQVSPYFSTALGSAYLGDAADLLKRVPTGSVNLVVTSPPSALVRKKAYGNVDEKRYLSWFVEQFAYELHRVLADDASLVLCISGAYKPGAPDRSLYCYELLLRLCDDVGFHLAQDFYLHNRARLPTPAEWVTVRRVRAKSQVDPVWWLAKSPSCKANNRAVLTEYSDSQKRIIKKGFERQVRPSGHVVQRSIAKDNGGAIPPNLITVSNTSSNDSYQRLCRANGVKPHPARTPHQLPEFFIEFLTAEGDMVLDPFAGSNTVGAAAERLNRRWMAFEKDQGYLEGAKFRFKPWGENGCE